MVGCSSALYWRVILCFSPHNFKLLNRSQMQSSLASLIVAVFKRNSV